jgi:hypothetical protein
MPCAEKYVGMSFVVGCNGPSCKIFPVVGSSEQACLFTASWLLKLAAPVMDVASFVAKFTTPVALMSEFPDSGFYVYYVCSVSL